VSARLAEVQPASRTALVAAFVACCAIWGSTFLVIRVGNEAVAPVWAATLRLATASALLWIWIAIRKLSVPRGIALSAALQYGAFQFGMNFPLLYWGEKIVPSGLSAVFYATAPLTLALYARSFGLEQLTRRKITGAVLGLLGVVIIFSSELLSSVPWLPLTAVFFSALVASFGSTLLKRGPAQSPVGVNAVGCALGAGMCLLWSFLIGESHALPRTADAIGPIVYLTLAGSLGAFMLWAWLVHHAPLTKISYIAVLVPLVALAVGAVARHERVSTLTLAGAIVVLVGVAVGLRASSGRKPA
jgi:drug/metabolite transporter (DMT)-like permease